MNIIQVVGGPGSGKTTLAVKLAEDWPGTASLLRIDRYLRARRASDGPDFVLLPSSIDWPLVMAHLGQLAAGQAVIMPVYDWARGVRLATPHPAPAEHLVAPCDWLVVEGLYYVPDLPSIRLFVDAPAEVRRQRSLLRDTRLSQTVGDIYDQVSEPVYQQHILPQCAQAAHVLNGCLDRATLANQARRFLAAQLSGWG